MKILYVSVHEILEFDECRMLTEMGHEVYSLHGAYSEPTTPCSKRPAIPDMHFSKRLRADELAIQCSREHMLPQLLDLFDLVWFMHAPQFVISNWENLRGRNVVWRSIGQSVPGVEHSLAQARAEGLKIVRYSPAESRIPGFVGSDAMIRFGKEVDEYSGWTGGGGNVVNFTQSLKERGTHCAFNVLDQVAKRLPNFRVYGPGNDELPYSGGCLSSEDLIHTMRTCEAYIATGTHPASYTLNVMEAMLTGAPMIVAGDSIGQPYVSGYPQSTYEMAELITHCEDGIIANTPNEFINAANLISNNREVAEALSERGRAKAIELFGMETIKAQWAEFLGA